MDKELNCGILFSTGKDSVFATYLTYISTHTINAIIIIKPKNNESYMFHHPFVEYAKEFEKIFDEKKINPKIYIFETSDDKEIELDELKKALFIVKKECNINSIITGAIASEYQRMRIGFICEDLGLKTFSPLWNKNQDEYMRELINASFDPRIISISSDGIKKELLLKELNITDIDKLINSSKKYGFNSAFEGGEAETIVLDCPLYKNKINLDYDVIKESNYNYYIKIKHFNLLKKN